MQDAEGGAVGPGDDKALTTYNDAGFKARRRGCRPAAASAES